jgi:3'(2'), 5'-bisphosphate nucleotidase
MLSDHQIAVEIADTAGRLLNAMRHSPLLAGKPLGAAGDATANVLITKMLELVRPDDGFLSEETAPDPKRLAMQRVWIIDPLDGTREYGEAADKRSDWAVHVALTEGGRPTACAVSLPALDLTFSTDSPPVLPPPPGGPIKILVSRTRAPDIAHKVAAALGAELVPMGSAGAKAMAVLRGEAHAYLHAGGQYEWDSCAPVGVALAAGLHASRIDGSPCVYNQADTSMPDLLICRPELAKRILAVIAAANEGTR